MRSFRARDYRKRFVHLGDQISHYEAVETRYAIKDAKEHREAGAID